jgi:hypothetical protein
MSTTVIVIRGNSSQSLLNRIADALQDPQETKPVQVKVENLRPTRTPNKFKYTLNPQSEKAIKRYIKQHPSFHYSNLVAYMRSLGFATVFNKDIVEFLQKNRVQKTKDLQNKTNIWVTQKR